MMGTKVTDGVAYIMRNGYTWFVTDAIALIRMSKDFKDQPFICIKLKMTNPKECVVEYTDGDGNILHKNVIEYTTAQRELTLFYTNEVLLLSGEY
jgi:hypothetical protein